MKTDTQSPAVNLEDLRKKFCMFGYQPTISEVSLVNDLLYELHCYRNGGVTEEMLRRNDGYIRVGRGCIIAIESEKPSRITMKTLTLILEIIGASILLGGLWWLLIIL